MSFNITNNNITIEKIDNSIVINFITVLSTYIYGFFLQNEEFYYKNKINKYNKRLIEIDIELDKIELELNNIIKEIEYEFEKI
jgi:hypothetical protein